MSGLERPVSALAWELRTHMALRRTVRLTLSERCDGVLENSEGQRILEGEVQRVSPTNAFCIIRRRHVPLEAILSVSRPHFSQASASDPTDVLERESAAFADRLGGA